jgi:hypothetical protein
MSNINSAPVAGSVSSDAASIHPALLESHGSITNSGSSHPVGLPVVNGPQTSFAVGSVERAAGAMDAQGIVTTVR